MQRCCNPLVRRVPELNLAFPVLLLVMAVWSLPLACSGDTAEQDAASAAPAATQIPLSLPAIEVQGRRLVPMRDIFEALGATVRFAEGYVIAEMTGRPTLRFQPGSKQVFVGEVATTVDVPSVTWYGTTFVPLRFIVTSLGAQDLRYDDQTSKCTFTFDQVPYEISLSLSASTERQADRLWQIAQEIYGKGQKQEAERLAMDAIDALFFSGIGQIGEWRPWFIKVREIARFANSHRPDFPHIVWREAGPTDQQGVQIRYDAHGNRESVEVVAAP